MVLHQGMHCDIIGHDDPLFSCAHKHPHTHTHPHTAALGPRFAAEIDISVALWILVLVLVPVSVKRDTRMEKYLHVRRRADAAAGRL